MKILITEEQLRQLIKEDDYQDKLMKSFEGFMKKYTNLKGYEREIEDENYDIYNVIEYYEIMDDEDIDEDEWENNNAIFVVVPLDDYGDKVKLEYDRYLFKTIIDMFDKETFEEFLTIWFKKHFNWDIEYAVGV